MSFYWDSQEWPACPACGSLPGFVPLDEWFMELRKLVIDLPKDKQDLPSPWIQHTIRQSVDCTSGPDYWSDRMDATPAEALADAISAGEYRTTRGG